MEFYTYISCRMDFKLRDVFLFLMFFQYDISSKKLRIYVISTIIASTVAINCIWDIPLPFYVWSDPITLEFVFGMFVASKL